MTAPNSLRPAGITAAAVLLLFLGGEMVVTALVLAGEALWPTTVGLGVGSPVAHVAAVGAILIAWLVVRSGVGLLLGTSKATDAIGFWAGLAGLTALVIWGYGVVYVVLKVMSWGVDPLAEPVKTAAFLIGFAAHVVLLLVASHLLAKHASRYEQWRATTPTAIDEP